VSVRNMAEYHIIFFRNLAVTLSDFFNYYLQQNKLIPCTIYNGNVI